MPDVPGSHWLLYTFCNHIICHFYVWMELNDCCKCYRFLPTFAQKHYTEKQELNWIFHVNSSCLLWKPLPVRLYGLRCQFILFQFNCFASFTGFLSVLESTTSMSGINKCRNAEMWLNESYSNNNPAHPITWLLCVHFITRTNWLIKGK